jgi:RecA-family ATPase
LGRVFCRTYISELIGPGGVGKTATRAAQYLSLTSGRSPTGEKIWKRCRVLAISLEDNAAEANRRFTAAMIHHDVTKAEVGGWLFVSAPGARVGKLLALDKKGRSFRDILADVIEMQSSASNRTWRGSTRSRRRSASAKTTTSSSTWRSRS